MKSKLLLSALILGFFLSACSQKLPVPTNKDTSILIVPTSITNKTQYRFPFHYELIHQPETETHIKIVPQLAYNYAIIDDFVPGEYEITAVKIISTPGEGLPSIGARTNEFSKSYPLRIRPGEIKILDFVVVVEAKYTNPRSVEQTIQTVDFRPLGIDERDQITKAVMALPNAEYWSINQTVAGRKEDKGLEYLKPLTGLDCYKIGLQYEKGEKVQRDMNKAMKWYKMSSDKDYLAAKNRLKELCGRYPDICKQAQ